MKREQMIALIRRYENQLEQMQSKVFYCEDEDGVLRRWSPPPLLIDALSQRIPKETTQEQRVWLD